MKKLTAFLIAAIFSIATFGQPPECAGCDPDDLDAPTTPSGNYEVGQSFYVTAPSDYTATHEGPYWEYTGSGYTTSPVSGQPLKRYITLTGCGACSITFKYYYADAAPGHETCKSVSPPKTVNVGVLKPASVSGDLTPDTWEYINYTCASSPGATYYNWWVSGGDYSIQTPANTTSVYIQFEDANTTYTVGARAHCSCDYSPYRLITVTTNP